MVLAIDGPEFPIDFLKCDHYNKENTQETGRYAGRNRGSAP